MTTERKSSEAVVFVFYWLLLFALYLPAARAGRVGDFPGWVHFLTSTKFFDYINRADSGIPSMYQFTQIVTYIFYKLFGANAWLWHLLFISMHAINAWLLFTFFKRLFAASSLRNGTLAAVFGGFLFCASPYVSEVVVWESAFHYLLALMMMMGVLLNTQKFLATPQIKYAIWAGVLFLLSTFSLEFFYMTPLFVLTLILYFRLALNTDKKIILRTLLLFSVPQLLFFLLHFVVLYARYHGGVAHITTASLQVNETNLAKGPKYIFHILGLGRFWPDKWRSGAYRWCGSPAGLGVFYGLISIAGALIVMKFRQMNQGLKLLSLLLIWWLGSLAFLLPLWFQQTGLVIYDRYSYVLDAFLYMFLAALVFTAIPRYLSALLLVTFISLNIRFTHKVNSYWQQSAHIVNNLVSTFPNDPSKKVLLLNLPECLDGVQMVGTRDDGEFRMMYNAIQPGKITNPVYDVEAFYMRGPDDGAHVLVVNDSIIRVTLNQWGTWWLYYGFGATSYENSDFKVDMRDVGHWYDLTLKHPANEYLLLYTVGSDWKKVDWNKKNVDQN